MKYFPLKTILFCILIVPLLFTTTLTMMETYLNTVYQRKIQNNIINEYKNFINQKSSVSDLSEQFIIDSIDEFIINLSASDMLVKNFNLDIAVRIMDMSGKLIYPYYSINGINKNSILDKNYNYDRNIEKTELQNSNEIQNKTISDTEMVTVQIKVLLRQNNLIFNTILFVYIGLTLSVFWFFYKQAIAKINRDDLKRRDAISSLVKDEQEYIAKLEALKQEREILAEKLKQAKADYQEESRRASLAEEELFEEIVELEKKVEENILLQQQKEEEIENLKNQLEKIERRKGGGKKRKTADVIEKRFVNLYKNIQMNERAIEGLLDLDDDDMQLKAEELIHQLNYDPAGVTVKRKVFAGKKNKTASFEVLFAYNGRLYFRNLEGNRIEILVIGTKNTQDKDMEFLHYI
ncbi:MAG: hypothetical protein HQK73_02260 [Desulfamplus sp.]|nr:hypothetical protein [Desulfamplus sp.]